MSKRDIIAISIAANVISFGLGIIVCLEFASQCI
jgi:hypothetical protein